MTSKHEYHDNIRDWAGVTAVAANVVRHYARPDWFTALHRNVFATNAALFAATQLPDGHSACLPLVALAPGKLAALANYYSFRWQPMFTADTSYAALVPLLCDLRSMAYRVDFEPVSSEGDALGDAAQLRAALDDAGWLTFASPVSTSHWLDTHGQDFAAWWATRPGALRSTVARKAKRGAVEIIIHTAYSDSAWGHYCDVYAASWKPPESHPAFLRDVAMRSAADGELRLGIASIAGEPVAAQLWTVECGVAHIHKLAHVQGHDALSPGTLLTHAMFAHAFDVDRVSRIDFGTGDDGYKRDWMDGSAPLMRITAMDLRQWRSWPLALRATLSSLVSAARRR